MITVLIRNQVTFSLVAGVDPSVGLRAAWIMCLITSMLGGRPGMISGAVGSMAVVMPSLVDRDPLLLYYAVLAL